MNFFLSVSILFVCLVVVGGQVTSNQNFNPAVNNQNECKDSTKLDGTSDCAQSASWCNRDNWTTFMTQMCPKTCCKCVNRQFNVYYGYYYYGRK